MERVAFLVESTGERITCLLNPEHVVHRRLAGLSRPSAGSGVVTGSAVGDALLLHTGGGRTELDLDLLFDVDLVPTPVPVAALPPRPDDPASPDAPAPLPAAPSPPRDVRDLTRALWNLAENGDGGDPRRVPQVRFVWGKAWNVLAVVESLSERLERFDASGTPGRSWLRMRLVRVPDPAPAAPGDGDVSGGEVPGEDALAAAVENPLALHEVVGAGWAGVGDGGGAEQASVGGETLPEIAAAHYGDRPWLWRWIAEANGLDDVVWPAAGAQLIIPPAPEDLP
ncbi:MAG: hypothetical protein U0Q15_00175 [Kineosporiaceae bacterium]